MPAKLAFEHPVTGKTITVESPLPADFTALAAKMLRQP